jgi:hypothetical protein
MTHIPEGNGKKRLQPGYPKALDQADGKRQTVYGY